MKTQQSILTLFFSLCFLFIANTSFSQCSISEVTATVTACEGDDFDVEINFEYEDVTNQFTIVGNGVSYGTYQYIDLPISLLTLNANCDTEYEFVITDEINDDCSGFVELGPVCCEDNCMMSGLLITTSDCDGGFIDVTIDFDFSNTSESFFYNLIGVVEGTANYIDLPLTINISSDLSGISIVITDSENNNCALESFFDNPCVDDPCVIGQIETTIQDCESEYFNVIISFAHENNSEQFTVAGNGENYGQFFYSDLPITIFELLGDCETEYEFIVTDLEDNDCSNFTGIDAVCCDIPECAFSNLILDPSSCENGSFNLFIDFDYSGNTNDFFDLFIYDQLNEIVIQEFVLFTALPLTVTISNTESQYFVVSIFENDNNNCGIDGDLTNPCYEESQCEMSNLVIGATECQNGIFTLDIDFNYSNTSGTFDYTVYDVSLDINISGSALYSDLPISLDIENAEESTLVVSVNDSENETCGLEAILDNPCYESESCFIGEILATSSDCNNDNQFSVTIDFEHNNTSDQFNVVGNGMNYGLFNYSELPIIIDGFLGDCASVYEFIVQDANNSDCTNFAELGPICCEEEDCEFLDFILNASECNQGSFDLTIDFDYSGTTNDFYDYIIYDQLNEVIAQGFEPFAQLPFSITISNTESQYFVVSIFENDNDGCFITGELDNPCFEETDNCFIGGITVTQSDCNGDGLFSVTLDFDYENTSNQFTVSGNGNSYGTFFYSDLPITIEGLEGNCETQFEFVVHDVNNNDCASDIDYGVVCCGDDQCQMTTLDFGANPICENGMIVTEWLINGVNISEVGYDIFINGEFQLFVEYDENSWYDFDIIPPLTAFFSITVCDNDNADCCIDWEVENPCYEGESCSIGEISVTTSDCNENNEFFVTIDFDYNNTSDQFMLNGNGMNYGLFSYSDLPISIEGFSGDCETEYEFVVHDVNNNDCTNFAGLDPVCCEEEDCEFLDLILNASECNQGSFDLTIDFDYSGTTNDFYDYIIYDQLNEVIVQGFEPFAQLPFSITISNTESQYFVVSIFENDNDGCFITGDLENPCYEDGEGCFIGNISVTTSDCNDAYQFSVTLDFDYANTSDQFMVNGNGMTYGLFSYSDLPISIEGFSGDCETEYEFVVHDVNNNDCTNFTELDPVCCEGDQCQMTTLDFGPNPVCENGMIITEWLIDGENVSEVGYDIYINGEFQLFVEYEEDSWYDFDIIPPFTAYFSITVCDNDNSDCCIDWEVENPCYEGEDDCELSDLMLGATDCVDGEFTLTIDFDYSGNSNEFYDYNIYDQANEIIAQGYAPFAQLPFSIELANTESEYFVITIFENDNDGCFITGEIENPCFMPPAGDCWIDDVTVTVIACEGSVFDLQIDFEYEDTSDHFLVNGNGNSYGTFSYADLPITLTGLEADCDTEFEFVIHDVNDNDCTAGVDYGTVCCEDFNNIFDIIITDFIDQDFINIDVNVIISLLNGCNLEVYMNGDLYTILTEQSTNFDIGPFECGTDQVIVLTFVNTCTEESIDFEVDISDIDCTTSVESFDILNVVIWNQVQQKLLVNESNDGSYNLQVLSIAGRLVSQHDKVQHGKIIDLSGLHTGIYIVRLTDEGTSNIGLMKIVVF